MAGAHSALNRRAPVRRSPRARRAAHSLYQDDDGTDPRSHRFQLWVEPGPWTIELARGGVPYSLFAYGVTDEEFFALADSVVSR